MNGTNETRNACQPIETAPDEMPDGVMVYCPTFYQGKGGWIGAHRIKGVWRAFPSLFKLEPTHWMPMPSPPNAGTDAAREPFMTPLCDKCGNEIHEGWCGICPRSEPDAAARDATPSDQARDAERCAWNEDADGIWESACGESWCFTEGGVAENNVKFCHRCGKPVDAHAYVDPYDDDAENAAIAAERGEKCE